MPRSPFSCVVAAVVFGAPVPAQGLVAGPTFPLAAPVGIGDVDGDGRGDYTGIVGASAVVRSGATGATIVHFTRPAAALEYFAPAGDLDADGCDDVAWHSAAGEITAISGRDGSTLWSWPLSSAGTPYNVGTTRTAISGGADFDADGFDDVILRAAPVLDVRSGRTGQVIHSMTAGFYPVVPGIVIGDADGDGYEDFTVSEPAQLSFRIVRGPFFATTTLSPNQRCWIGDANGNGAIDYVQQTTFGVAQVLDGATGALLGTVTAGLPQSASVAITPAGDVDGDGRDDFHAAVAAWPLPPVPALQGVVSGATLTLLPGSPAAAHSSVGDIDGDGRVELSNGAAASLQWNDPSIPVASRLVRRGGSGTTSLGTKLRVQTRGSAAMGRPVFFDVRGMLPNGVGLFLLGSAVDVDLASLGAPGNRLRATPDGSVAVLANATGLAVLSFTIPVDPSLLGTALATQVALFDPAANALAFVFSNAIDVRTND